MSTEKPMTKTETRAWLKRIREGVRDLADLIETGGSVEDIVEAGNEILGSVSHLQEAAEESRLPTP